MRQELLRRRPACGGGGAGGGVRQTRHEEVAPVEAPCMRWRWCRWRRGGGGAGGGVRQARHEEVALRWWRRPAGGGGGAGGRVRQTRHEEVALVEASCRHVRQRAASSQRLRQRSEHVRAGRLVERSGGGAATRKEAGVATAVQAAGVLDRA
eukprot:365087-Chlamydomonas_euryale.AAC.14